VLMLIEQNNCCDYPSYLFSQGSISAELRRKKVVHEAVCEQIVAEL